MNHRVGRFGRQEAVSLTALSGVINGFFAVDNAAAFQHGNVQYLTSLLGAVFAWLLLEWTVYSMRRVGARTLHELLSALLGSVGASVASVVLLVALCLAAALPLLQLLIALSQFIFVDAEYVNILLYFLLPILLLVFFGMETLARMSRLFFPIVLIGTLFALLTGFPAYRTFRLYPLAFAPKTVLGQTLSATFRFVPSVLLLLIGADALQGLQNVRFCGRMGLGMAGGLVVLTKLCLGLSYAYSDLRGMSAPLYRLILEVRTEDPALRADRLIMFLWVMGGIVAAASYLYAASLLFVRSYRVGDVRPIGAILSCMTILAVLSVFCSMEETVSLLKGIYRYGWTLAVNPLVLVNLIGLFRRKEKPVCGERSSCCC